jgi:hypothetical protein
MYLALVVLTAWTAWRGHTAHVVAVAWLAQGIPHLFFYATHLDGLADGDRAALLVSLAGVPVLAALARWSATRAPLSATPVADSELNP